VSKKLALKAFRVFRFAGVRASMETIVRVSSETYNLLQRRAQEIHSSPEALAESAIRLQLGNTAHIEQRRMPSGVQAYLRGTRVAVRHIAAFLKAGHSAEQIIRADLPHLSAAAIYEAIAYYYDHQAEIDAELDANSEAAIQQQLRQSLSPEQYTKLTGRTA
jgi:uncharacterized protein (DUF433 family)